MNKTNELVKSQSVWQPRFIEEINQYNCLGCSKFNEVAGRNAFRLQTVENNNTNSQTKIINVANPEQCADCVACTDNYTEELDTHYSISV